MSHVNLTMQTRYNGWSVDGIKDADQMCKVEDALPSLTVVCYDEDGILISEPDELETEVRAIVKRFVGDDTEVTIKYDDISS